MTGTTSPGQETRPDPREVAAARAEVRRVLGAAVEGKASDLFCLAHQRRTQGRSVGFAAESFGPVPAVGPPVATVVEFGDTTVPRGLADVARDADWARLADAVAGIRGAAPADALLRPATVLRQALVTAVRNDGYGVVSPVYDEIERLSAGPLQPGPAPQVPTLVTQVCWLNRTLRTWTGMASLAEVAADTAVSGIDVPRRLMPDATALRHHTTVGLPGFVQQRSVTGRGVTVAVIDSEVAGQHPALSGRVVHRRNYTPEPWGTPDGHGTAVAGIVGSRDGANPGIAPEVTIYNYKVLATNRALNSDDFGGALALQQALEDNVDIANCSWGAGPAGAEPSREARAVDAASALGMTTVKSAGNLGPGRGTMTTPADASTAVVVGATDLDGRAVEDYSARGPAGARPGPDVVAPGGSPLDALVCCLVSGGFGSAGHGTSFAAPHVTGVLALLLESEPALLPDDLRAWVRGRGVRLARIGAGIQGEGLFVAG
jgi:serine protease AprX